jgi:hypothetical protein
MISIGPLSCETESFRSRVEFCLCDFEAIVYRRCITLNSKSNFASEFLVSI